MQWERSVIQIFLSKFLSCFNENSFYATKSFAKYFILFKNSLEKLYQNDENPHFHLLNEYMCTIGVVVIVTASSALAEPGPTQHTL